MSASVNKLRSLRAFMAMALLALTCAVSFHFHKKETAQEASHCSFCVAGHQLKSGAGLTLDKADAPIFTWVALIQVRHSAVSFLESPPQNSRAPPSSY